MRKKWPWVVARAVMGLVLIGLIVGGGFAVFRMGWSQGYLASGAVEGDIEPAGPRMVPMAPWLHGYRGHYGGPGRFILSAGLIVLAFVVVSRVLRALAWGAWAHGSWGRMPHPPWDGHRFHGHGHPGWPGPCGPWGKPPAGWAGEGADEADPETPDAQA